MKKLLNKDAVILDLKATSKAGALKEISLHLSKNDFIDSSEIFEKALLKREKEFSTDFGEGVAIPHAQSDTVKKNVILIAKSKNGIKWNNESKNKVKYIFSIALNKNDSDLQVEALKSISIALLDKDLISKLDKADTKIKIIDSLLVKKEVKEKNISKNAKKIVAITSCPTGIAHTYLAAETIEKTANDLGYSVKVETQGRRTENSLNQKDIDEADVIILAIDKDIDGMSRFAGKTVIKTSTKNAIHNTKQIIKDGLEGKGKMISSSILSDEESSSGDYSWAAFKDVYKNLMGGVSKMLPFIVAGGIILGIGFLLDTGNSGGTLGVTRDIAGWFSGLGKLGLGIFVPVLGGYVAYSIVGAEGLMPGFIAGLIASGGGLLYAGGAVNPHDWANVWGRLTPGIDQSVLVAGSGFIGAMVGGYMAAAAVTILRKYVFKNVHKNLRGATDIVFMPVASTLLVGVSMFILQIPLAYFAYGLKQGLIAMNDHGLIVLLTIIIGAMMAVDMGGPVNKVAYVLATGLIGASSGVTETDYIIMGAVMIGGMVPPLSIALSAVVFRGSAWSKQDRESAKANWLLGAFFITEGAIPFAAKDPKRVIPSIIVGSAISGLLVGLLKVGVSAPHGGIIVASLFKSYLFSSNGMQIGMGITFMIAIITVSSTVSAFMLGFWKRSAIKKGKLVLATA